MKRRMIGSALLGGVFALSVMVGVAPHVAAQESDYFADVLGDPMDFGNDQDMVTNVVNEAPFVGATNKSISGGQLHFDAAGAFAADFVWPGFPTGIPHGREGGKNPIDAGKYSRLVIRMNAPAGTPLGIRWYNCLTQSKCEGGSGFAAGEGWQTYDIALGQNADPSIPLPWSGTMTGLRLAGSLNGHIDIDWIRLVPAGAQNVGELVGGPSRNIRPTDKLDFATAAGNPWDMDSMGDIAETVALKPGFSIANNTFSGCSVGTSTGQFPGLVFNMPGGKVIDAARFKTLTFEYSYPGAFSSRPTVDGGTFARVFWFDPAGNRHPTNAIHLYPNENVVQVRLDDPATMFQGIEPGKGKATGAPWAGKVTSFRINPNDTKGGKCFTIGRVWLTSDDPAGTPIEMTSGAVASKSANSATGAKATTGKKGVTKTTKKKK